MNKYEEEGEDCHKKRVTECRGWERPWWSPRYCGDGELETKKHKPHVQGYTATAQMTKPGLKRRP